MRRIRLRTGRLALFGAMLAAALILCLPLRLALGWAGLAGQGMTAASVGGTIWSGSLRAARFGEVALGDLDAGVAPLPLLIGRARVDMASRGESPRIDGAIMLSRHRAGIDDVTASIPLGRALAPLPIVAVELTDVSAAFVDGVCERAQGRVRAVMAGSALPVPQGIAGDLRCDGDALLLPLVAGPGEGATLRLWQDGRYRADLSLAPADPGAATALRDAGFIDAGGGWRLSAEGRF